MKTINLSLTTALLTSLVFGDANASAIEQQEQQHAVEKKAAAKTPEEHAAATQYLKKFNMHQDAKDLDEGRVHDVINRHDAQGGSLAHKVIATATGAGLADFKGLLESDATTAEHRDTVDKAQAATHARMTAAPTLTQEFLERVATNDPAAAANPILRGFLADPEATMARITANPADLAREVLAIPRAAVAPAPDDAGSASGSGFDAGSASGSDAGSASGSGFDAGSASGSVSVSADDVAAPVADPIADITALIAGAQVDEAMTTKINKLVATAITNATTPVLKQYAFTLAEAGQAKIIPGTKGIGTAKQAVKTARKILKDAIAAKADA